MVDITAKIQTARRAVAEGFIAMSPAALSAIKDSNVAKGDVLATARIAGIMAAKKTAELIPLCHPIGLDAVHIEFEYSAAGIAVSATAQIMAKTGVEMEALTAVSISLLTIYDMAKSIDKHMVIGDIRLLAKTGGKSGDVGASPPRQPVHGD